MLVMGESVGSVTRDDLRLHPEIVDHALAEILAVIKTEQKRGDEQGTSTCDGGDQHQFALDRPIFEHE